MPAIAPWSFGNQLLRGDEMKLRHRQLKLWFLACQYRVIKRQGAMLNLAHLAATLMQLLVPRQLRCVRIHLYGDGVRQSLALILVSLAGTCRQVQSQLIK